MYMYNNDVYNYYICSHVNKKTLLKWGWISNNGEPLWWKIFCTYQSAGISYKCRMFSWNSYKLSEHFVAQLARKCVLIHVHMFTCILLTNTVGGPVAILWRNYQWSPYIGNTTVPDMIHVYPICLLCETMPYDQKYLYHPRVP